MFWMAWDMDKNKKPSDRGSRGTRIVANNTNGTGAVRTQNGNTYSRVNDNDESESENKKEN